MGIYLICFGASVLLAYFAKRTGNKRMFILLSVFSVGITVVLAGLRDISIGIDTHNYYYHSWNNAMLFEGPFLNYIKFFLLNSRERFELLFGVLVGIVAKTTGSYSVFLLLVHSIIVGGVYIGAFRMRDHSEPDFTLLLFYLLYYNQSLNIFRQYMAMAIIFAAMADLEKRKFVRYTVFVAIAFLIHNTAIMGLILLLLYYITYPTESSRRRLLLGKVTELSPARRLFICAIIVLGAYAFLPLVRLLIANGILSAKYLYYIDSDETSSYRLVMMFLAVEVLGIVLLGKKMRDSDLKADYYLLNTVSFIVMIFLATTIKYGKRIAAYFSFSNLLVIGMMVQCHRLINNRRIIRAVILTIALVYWGYVYAYRNASQTIPYQIISHT